MKLPIKLLLLVISSYLISTCGRTIKESTIIEEKTTLIKEIKPKPMKKSLSYEYFDSFYNKFHMDSTFQMSRINFPLKGYDMDSSEQPAIWNKKNWIMHRAKISDVDTSHFNVDLITKLDYRKEKVYIQGGGFNLERIFKRINGEWFLVLFINEEM